MSNHKLDLLNFPDIREKMVIVHASFSRFSRMGVTPEEILDFLIGQVGQEGTLMMPTFTYSYAGIWNLVPFDPNTTPGLGNGILSEVFRKRNGVLRSAHPTYSVASFGKHAESLTSGKENATPLGVDSSYGQAMELSAKILLLNVGNNRNSMIHYVEAVSGLPYNDIPWREFWGREALTVHGLKKLPDEFPACSEKFSELDEPLVKAGIAQKFEYGYFIDAKEMRCFILERLAEQKDYLLCNDCSCEPCTLRRRRLRELKLI